MDLGLEFQKSKTGFGISTSKIPYEPIFSQNGQLWISWPKFRKITQLRAIFWFDVIVEGVAESWVEVDGAEWRRMELGGAGWRWMVLGRGGWIWVEVDGAGWNWVHGLVILFLKTPHPPSYWQISHSKFSLITEMQLLN